MSDNILLLLVQCFLFVFSTFLCILFAIIVFFSESSIYSVFSLLFVILLASCLMLFVLGVEFLAVAAVMIYAGAIIVIFLFVIISADLRREDTIVDSLRLKKYSYITLSCFIFFILSLNCFFVDSSHAFDFFNESYLVTDAGNNFNLLETKLKNSSDINIIGSVLYSQFFIFFLLLGFLLCVSMVASISLCFRPYTVYDQRVTPRE